MCLDEVSQDEVKVPSELLRTVALILTAQQRSPNLFNLRLTFQVCDGGEDNLMLLLEIYLLNMIRKCPSSCNQGYTNDSLDLSSTLLQE